MNLRTPVGRHRWRWVALGGALVLAGLLAALAWHVHALLQPERFTTLLERDLSAAGLTLTLHAPAEPKLFPHPGVELRGLALSNTGSATPLLRADAATIVVPWRALLRGAAAIERVDIDAPRVDLGELKALLARLPRRKGPPTLPTIVTGVHMRQGTLSDHGSPLLFGFTVDTGALAPGRPFQLDATAHDGSGRTLDASLVTVPSQPRNGAIEFAPIRFRFDAAGGASLQLEGHGTWRGGEDLALDLAGVLRHVVLAPPPPPSGSAPAASVPVPTAGDATQADRLALTLTPRRGATPLTVTLKVDGADAAIDATLQPTELAGWWNRLLAAEPGQIPPQPFAGHARIERLEVGPVKVRGLQIEAVPDAAASAGTPPAAASSAAN